MDEPCMLAQKPSSSHLQSTSHILKSTFQNLFALEKVDAETIRNLSASRRGNKDYHDKYVERLLVVHNKWSESTSHCHQLVQYLDKAREDARILEQKEEEERAREFDSYSSLGLPPVTSKLTVFIDDSLLKHHSLINPNEILDQTQQVQVLSSENESMPQYESSTFQSRQLFEKIPPIDCFKPMSPAILPKGSTVLDPPVRVKKNLLNGNSGSADRNVWRNCINPLQRSIEKKDLENLQKKANFLKNPRLVDIPKSFLNKSVGLIPDVGADMDYFKPFPCPVMFTDYKVNLHYQIKLELKNITSSCRQVRILQPSSTHFSVSQGEFPLADSLVAPGMSCSYTVTFVPDNLGDFDDTLIVKTQAKDPMRIPLQARRVPPRLTLPKVLDCGFSLVGDKKRAEYVIQNLGGAGRFCFQDSDISIRNWDTEFVEGGSSEFSVFTLTPASFSLASGETVNLEVMFEPTAVQVFSAQITLHCDNCTKEEYVIEGCGEMARVELSYVQDGTIPPKIDETCDSTAERIIQFGKQYPGVTTRRQIHITNTISVPLEYRWGVLLPALSTTLADDEVTNSMFSVEPNCGFLPSSAVATFDILYCPQESGSFYNVVYLKLLGIPVRQGDGTYVKEDETALKLSLKGTTQEYTAGIVPPSIVMAGNYFIGNNHYKTVSVRNLSSAPTTFRWKSVDDDECRLALDPREGDIEACGEVECLLTIQGKAVGHIQRMIEYEIPFSTKNHVLYVECEFSGPIVTFCEIKLSFGLVRFGELVTQIVTVANNSPISAFWCVAEHKNETDADNSVFTFSPGEGVIEGNSTQQISVSFLPNECKTLSTLLQCEVVNGQTCYLPVHAEVLCPCIRLKTCEILIEEAFLDVFIERTVTLMNLNLLEAEFDWNLVSNDVITISCEPKQGILLPGQCLDVNLRFCFHQLGELEQLVACGVKEVVEPLVLSIRANVHGLNVELTMPSMDDIRHQHDIIQNNDLLEFGINNPIGELVDAIVIIENKSAIETSFALAAKEFQPFCVPTPPDNGKKITKGSSTRPVVNRMFSATRTLHTAAQERSNHKDAVLQGGKGLAFVCSPSSGKLLPFETKIVTVTAYTDMWGEYFDTLICKIGDSNEKLIPMHIDVVGCPLNFQICKEQAVMVRFGAHVSGDKPLMRSLRINNTSHCDIRLDWQTFVVDRDDDHLVDLNVYIGDPFPKLDDEGEECLMDNDLSMNGKLISVILEEHCGNRSNTPFSIPTTQVTIPGKQHGSIDVRFHPPSNVLEETNYLGYALGYMSLEEKDRYLASKYVRTHGIDMMPFSLNTTAAVKPARLHLEACDEGGFHFEVSASDLLRGGEILQNVYCDRHFVVTNRSGAAVSFSFCAAAPFKIIPCDKDAELGVTKKVTLKSHANTEVNIRFEINSENAAAIYENKQHLIHRDLLIEFDNGKSQSYPLSGTVTYPSMEVSSTMFNLGVCFVGSRKECVLRISNPSKEILHWSIETDRKCPETSRAVFSFSNCEGVLDGSAVGSVEADVKVYFTPKHNVDYKCVVLVSSVFGKLCLNEEPIKVVLEGTGSYDEFAKAHHNL